MKNKLLQITFLVFMGFCFISSCKNNIDTKEIIVPKYNLDSLKKVSELYNEKINDCIANNKIDSLYEFGISYKNATLNNDTAWATKFIDIYTALDTAKKGKRILLLNHIIDKQSSDINFNIQKVKAICNLAYENENTPATYVKILENTLQLKTALDTLGPDYKNFIYQNIGETYTKLNDNKTGIQYLKLFYATSLEIKDIKSKNELLSQAAYGLGNTYRNMAAYDSAEHYCLIATQTPTLNSKTKALTYAALAEVYYDMGMPQKAETPAIKASQLLKNDTNENTIKTKAVINSILAEIEFLKKNMVNANKNALLSLGFYNQEKGTVTREKAKLLLTISKIKNAENNSDSAYFYTNTCISNIIDFNPKDKYDLPTIEKLKPENTIYEALDFKALLLENEYKKTNKISFLEKAIEAYNLSFKVENLLQQYFLNTSATLLQMQESRKRSEKAIAICYELYGKTKNNAWAEKAFAFAEKNKSIVLLESIKRNIAANGLLQNDSVLNKTISLQANIVAIEREITEASTDSIKQNKLAEKEKLETELLFAQTTLSNNNSLYKNILQKEIEINSTEVANKLLDNNSTLVEFFSTDSATYTFQITKNKPILFSKLDATITKSINSFLYFFENKNNISNNPVAYNAAAYDLYNQLGFSTISTKNVLLIPDGIFNFIPFEALTTNKTDAQNPKSFSYLLLQKEINYNYSAATMLQQLENNVNVNNKNIIAFAPVFENKERNKVSLLNSKDELASIEKENPAGKYFINKDATLSNFKKEINNASIVHIATHAQATSDDTHTPQIEFYDSTLYLNELYAMHIKPSLVVLSACETGIGKLSTSEGSMSLARGFYYAGAKNIITSLWSVDDKCTATIFSSFYKSFSEDNITSSLHNAKRSHIQNATAVNASPYYWAGFIHIGYQHQQSNHHQLILFIAILCIAIVTIIFFQKKKK